MVTGNMKHNNKIKKSKKEFRKYKQLFRMQISEARYIVISKTVDDKISMAQQIRVSEESGGDSFIFIKNAFIFQLKDFIKFQKALSEIEIENIKQ